MLLQAGHLVLSGVDLSSSKCHLGLLDSVLSIERNGEPWRCVLLNKQAIFFSDHYLIIQEYVVEEPDEASDDLDEIPPEIEKWFDAYAEKHMPRLVGNYLRDNLDIGPEGIGAAVNLYMDKNGVRIVGQVFDAKVQEFMLHLPDKKTQELPRNTSFAVAETLEFVAKLIRHNSIGAPISSPN